jgi:tetratricopeptide (TPR) repeat protein
MPDPEVRMAHRALTTILTLIMTVFPAALSPAQETSKPFTQDQVQAMVRDGLGDETGAKALEQRGIDFAPTEDFVQSLKAAGASQAFLAALRVAKHPEPATAKKPINQIQVFALLAGQVPSHRVAMLVQERGIDFVPDDEYLREVRLAGGDDGLVSVLKSAKVTKPEHTDPALQARQAEIKQHVARGIEFYHDKRFVDAEAEYRAALHLDPESPGLHFDLGWILAQKGDWDTGIAEYREALRLDPANDAVHLYLGTALGQKGDWEGMVGEQQEAIRLNPNNADAHLLLGKAFGQRGDWGGMVAEEREAVRLNPENDDAHFGLGLALGQIGDLKGQILQWREAVRLNSNNELAHYLLGHALEKEGDRQGALQEYRAAYELNPRNAGYRQAYENLLEKARP